MKFPFVTRRQLDRVKAQLAEAKKRVSNLKEQVFTLKSERDLARRRARDGFADIASKSRDPRKMIATALEGEGIEIGALHFPLPVSDRAKVRYVDMATRDENIGRFPHLDPDAIVETHYVCNGERLEAVPDSTQDFVIANHMIEHCINPIGAINNFLRVLKPGGLMFVALPDKRFTFDVGRPVTTWSHVENDFRIDRTVEDLSVYEEWAKNKKVKRDPVQMHKDQKNIHFHVWTQSEILELFVEARRSLGLPLEIEWAAKNGGEFIVLARKYGENEEKADQEHAKRLAEGMRLP